LTELWFYVPLDTKRHFGDVSQANLLAWYGKTKPNTTKAHIHQSKEMYNTKQTQKTKARFSRLLQHPARKWRGPILVLVLHNLSLTYLRPQGPHGACTGPISEKLLTNDIYSAQEAYCNKLQFFADSRAPRFVFVLLKCSQDVLTDRLQRRGGHFFDASLLQSQLDTFQEPLENEFDLITDGTRTVSEIVDIIISVL